MWPYFAPVFLCFFSCLFSSCNKKILIKVGNDYHIHSWIIILLFLLIFAGARGSGSGDYWEYLSRGKSILTAYDVFFNGINMDYGYCAIAFIVNKLKLPAQAIILFMNCISIVCVAIFIKKYSPLPFLSVLLFLPFFFQFDMHAARSACAMGILTLATPYIIERKPINFIGIYTLAVLFHLEALIGIILYFLPKIKLNLFSSISLLLVDLILAIPNLTDKICLIILEILGFNSLYLRFLGYTDHLNYFSYATHLYDPRFILFGSVFVLAFLRVRDKKDGIERLVRNTSFITIFLMILFVNHAFIAFRLSSFYALYSLITIPYILIIPSKKLNNIENEGQDQSIRMQEYYIAVMIAFLLSFMYALRINVPYEIFELTYW